MDNQALLFYVTIPNAKTGQEIAKHLLEKKLIACANIFPPHTSIYKWEGEIKNESEHVMILKTRSQKAPLVESEIKALHPYDCPCIIQLKTEATNQEFTDWLLGQTP